MTSSVPLDGSGAGNFTIPEIVQLAAEGRVRVPTFQRHFAWRTEDIRQLFDSLYRGFPVGTLLLWRQDASEGLVSLGPAKFRVPERSNAYWVVDGQQRITSLVLSLSPQFKDLDERFEVYFDLETQKFIGPRRGVIPARAIPVREALESRSLLQWLRLHGDELEPEDYDLADRLGGALRDYRIPAYIVSGDNQELLREVFDRVNSAGRPISRAQVFHALFASSDEPGSPASVVENLSKLGFGRLDEGRVVQSLLALRGGDVQRDIRTEFSPKERAADSFDETEIALTRAIEFLRSEGVVHQLLMPNTLPFPVLAAFFHLHPDPEPWNKRLLARWLWRGWVHEFGQEGGQTPVLRRAVRSVYPELGEPDTAPSEYEALRSLLEYTPDRAAPRLRMEKFSTRNANARLILLALASQGPLNHDGFKVDISVELERYGSEAVTEIIPGIRSNAASRIFWPLDSGSIVHVTDAKILASHLIDSDARELLELSDPSRFLEYRGVALSEVVHSFLDSRLEPGAKVRPPLRHIEIADADDASGMSDGG